MASHGLPEWVRRNQAIEGEDDARHHSSAESELSSRDDGCCNEGLGLRTFRAVELCTVAVACLTALANAWAVLASPQPTVKIAVLRVYVVGMATFVVPLELNLGDALKEMKIFENWFSRGVFYTFIGVVAASLGSDTSATAEETAAMYTAAAMFSCGVLYALLGATCQKENKELMLIEYRLLYGAS